MTTVLPQASAAASPRDMSLSGVFQGTMMATTPKGSLVEYMRRSFMRGCALPSTFPAHPAKYSKCRAEEADSRRLSLMGMPVLMASNLARVSACSRIRPASFVISFPRSSAGIFFQDGSWNARQQEATASSTCASEAGNN